MKNQWICRVGCVGFTVGKIYTENEDGDLIDDDGDVRMPAHYYRDFKFEKVKTKPMSMENK